MQPVTRGVADPLADMTDRIKNWQRPVRIFGITASFTVRNRVVFSFFTSLVYAVWQCLQGSTWFSGLEEEMRAISSLKST